jgi:hypothetical protein
LISPVSAGLYGVATRRRAALGERTMSKGMDSKKSDKKKPAKTMKEKKAEKKEKKKGR